MDAPQVEGECLGCMRRLSGLAEGYALLDAADPQGARAFFQAAAAAQEAPFALEALGLCGELLNDETTAIEARSAAYEIFRKRQDRLGAGRMAIWLAADYITFRGEAAVANGWLRRAHSYLDPLPVTNEHGWLALQESEYALMANNDGEIGLRLATRAREVGRITGEADLEMYGLAVMGLALVTSGHITDGMDCLDEAATACLTGEVRMHWVMSSIFCYMMDACDRVRDWERARQWIEHADAFSRRWKTREIYALCRTHYAVVLTWRGQWEEAEAHLQASIDDLISFRRPMATEGIVRLAELRCRQGRYEEAAALFERVQHDPLTQLGRAELALCLGQPAVALDLVERCLRRLPRNDCLERMPALELYIRACLEIDACEKAREGLPELKEIAESVATRPVRASAHLAIGLVEAADGNRDEARQHLQDAVDLFETSGAPYETARVSLLLAELSAAQRSEATALARRARERFLDLGALQDAARADLLLDRLMSEPATTGTAEANSPSDLTPREEEILSLLAEGLSNQEIAVRLVLSVRTVERHVSNIYSKLQLTGRNARIRAASLRHV